MLPTLELYWPDSIVVAGITTVTSGVNVTGVVTATTTSATTVSRRH